MFSFFPRKPKQLHATIDEHTHTHGACALCVRVRVRAAAGSTAASSTAMPTAPLTMNPVSLSEHARRRSVAAVVERGSSGGSSGRQWRGRRRRGGRINPAVEYTYYLQLSNPIQLKNAVGPVPTAFRCTSDKCSQAQIFLIRSLLLYR